MMDSEPTRWEYPRIARAFWVCPHCKSNVADRLIGNIDTSEGLPERVTVICSECGADLTFHVRWSMPDIHSVQLMDAGEPWFETEEGCDSENPLRGYVSACYEWEGGSVPMGYWLKGHVDKTQFANAIMDEFAVVVQVEDVQHTYARNTPIGPDEPGMIMRLVERGRGAYAITWVDQPYPVREAEQAPEPGCFA